MLDHHQLAVTASAQAVEGRGLCIHPLLLLPLWPQAQQGLGVEALEAGGAESHGAEVTEEGDAGAEAERGRGGGGGGRSGGGLEARAAEVASCRGCTEAHVMATQ